VSTRRSRVELRNFSSPLNFAGARNLDPFDRVGFSLHGVGVGEEAMGQIGEPLRRYTIIPLEEPVSPTREPIAPLPPRKSPDKAPPVTRPEPEPAQ